MRVLAAIIQVEECFQVLKTQREDKLHAEKLQRFINKMDALRVRMARFQSKLDVVKRNLHRAYYLSIEIYCKCLIEIILFISWLIVDGSEY